MRLWPTEKRRESIETMVQVSFDNLGLILTSGRFRKAKNGVLLCLQAEEDAVAVGQQDLPQAIQLLAEMGESADKVSKLVDSMLARVKKGEISTAKVSKMSF